MNHFLKFCISPLALAISNVGFATDTNWDGYYYGATINYVHNSNKTTTTFGNDGQTPAIGWNENNQFQGALYNSINSMSLIHPFYTIESDNITLSPLADEHSFSKNNVSATLLAGRDVQFDHLVLGGEFKFSFGNFGAENEQSLTTGSGNKSMSDAEGADLSFTNYDSSITGITSPINSSPGQSITNSVSFSQTLTNQNSYKMKGMISLAARAGIVYKQVMLYGSVGAAYAKVNAQTRLSLQESATGTVDVDSNITDYTGSSTYKFTGESSKHMMGYTVGTGAELSIQDHLRVRLGGEYYDLGKIKTQGNSTQTTASYSVSQKVTGYNVSIGLIKTF